MTTAVTTAVASYALAPAIAAWLASSASRAVRPLE